MLACGLFKSIHWVRADSGLQTTGLEQRFYGEKVSCLFGEKMSYWYWCLCRIICNELSKQMFVILQKIRSKDYRVVSLEGLNNNNNNRNYGLQRWASHFVTLGAYNIILSFVGGQIAVILLVSSLVSFPLSYMMQSLSCKPWVGYCFIKDSCQLAAPAA